MRRTFVVAGTLVIFAGLFVGPMARPARASWAGDNCFKDNKLVSDIRRADAHAYGYVAVQEGYEWGGGCWNDDNRDDTPGQPDSGGEGPDCSGLVFKSWHLRSTVGASGFRWWNKMQNIHGPYSSYDFHSPAGSDPFSKLKDKSRATTLYMDAFAKDGHVALINSDSYPGTNTDYILEALGDSSGTNIWIESYRVESAFVAVRRDAWTPDCFPNCLAQPGDVIVVS
jgi:hypothetical protein